MTSGSAWDPDPVPPVPPAAAGPGRREDVLVSVCFAAARPDAGGRAILREVAARIAARYRYWEMLVIAEAADSADHELLIAAVPNLRLIKVRNGTSFYRKRVVAAAEAIGDIVLLAATDEIAALDLEAMLDEVRTGGGIVMARRSRASHLDPLLRALGGASGFRVTTRNMLTVAYPRTLLNLILALPERQLALRFVPRDGGLPIRYVDAAEGSRPVRRSWLETLRRLGLVQKLVVHAAPRVLPLVAGLSALVAVAALVFAVYAVVVWLVLDDVQPGWLTTSLALSLTASFLGVAIFGLACGLQRLLDIAIPDLAGDVIEERSSVDLFSQVSEDLNIELDLEETFPDPFAGGLPETFAGTFADSLPADTLAEPLPDTRPGRRAGARRP